MEWCIYLILTEESTRNKPVSRLTGYLKYQFIRMLYWKNMIENRLKVNPMRKTE